LSFFSVAGFAACSVFSAAFSSSFTFLSAYFLSFLAIVLSILLTFASFLSGFSALGFTGASTFSSTFSTFSSVSSVELLSVLDSFLTPSFLSKPDEKNESILTMFFRKPHFAYSSALRAS